MPDSLILPLLKAAIPNGIKYSTYIIVEFDPQSVWYDTSFTLAAQALRDGVKTDYHTFLKMPAEIEERFTQFGLDVKKLEEEDLLRVIDSYTIQTGIGVPIKPKGSDHFLTDSVKISDWSIPMAKQIKAGSEEPEKYRLHVDDNTSVLMRYNSENEFIDYWRTRMIRGYARTRGCILINAFASGVCSEQFQKQLESICDGIIEFKVQEKDDELLQVFRVKSMHDMNYDSRWQKLRVTNGEVVIGS